MPQAILIFDITDPDEKDAFEDCFDSGKYQCVIYELDQWLRSKVKYEDLDEKEYEIYSNVRVKLHEYIDEQKVSLY